MLLHLRGTLHALGQRLRREAVVVDAVDDIAHIEQVFHHQHGVLRQEAHERGLLAAHRRQLGHNLYLLPFVARQLVLHLKGTDGVYIIAKEVDAERILAAVAVDIDDAATHGKLAGFVDIVHLVEAQFTQRMLQFGHVGRLPFLQHNGTLVELLLRDHQFGKGFWMRHNIQRRSRLGHQLTVINRRTEHSQHLGAQYLVGGVALCIFHLPAVRRGEEKHPFLAQHLRQVVIEITSLVGILQYEQHRLPASIGHRGKQHRCR